MLKYTMDNFLFEQRGEKMKLSYLYAIPVIFLIYILLDIFLFKTNKKLFTYKRLSYYLIYIVLYITFINHTTFNNFNDSYLGIPSGYWFVFVTFIGSFFIAFLLDIIFISQRSISEITTKGIKLSSEDRNVVEKQTNFLKHFNQIILAENEIIQNLDEYIKIEGINYVEGLLRFLKNQEDINYDEIQILENYLNSYFKVQKSESKVYVYSYDALDDLIHDFQFKHKDFTTLQKALHNNKDNRFFIADWNTIHKKSKDHHILCFCYNYQVLGKNVIIAIESRYAVEDYELLIISNILKVYETYLFISGFKVEMALENDIQS